MSSRRCKEGTNCHPASNGSHFTLLVVGDRKVGKSAVARYVDRNCGTLSPGALRELWPLVHFDLSGQSSPCLTVHLCEGKKRRTVEWAQFSAIVVVIDATNIATHYSMPDWLEPVLRRSGVGGCVPSVFANKIDLLPKSDSHQPLAMVEEACERNSVLLFKTSAKTGTNLAHAICSIMAEVVRRNLRIERGGRLTFRCREPLPPVPTTTKCAKSDEQHTSGSGNTLLALCERLLSGVKKAGRRTNETPILTRLNKRHFV